MNRATLDIWVGFFVALGLAALVFLALKVGNLTTTFGQNETYPIKAEFDNIGGLKVRAPVKSSGVVVGRVSDIHLDNQKYLAVVTLDIDKKVQFSRDTAAQILTSGLLGEQYVGLETGGDSVKLKGGDTIKLTSSAMVLEQLIGQFMYNQANGDKHVEKPQ